MDREKIEQWIAEYDKPSGPDKWVDPWTWAKAMKEVLAENERLRGELEHQHYGDHPQHVSKESQDALYAERDNLKAEVGRLRAELTQGLGPLSEGQIPMTPVESYRVGYAAGKADQEAEREG